MNSVCEKSGCYMFKASTVDATACLQSCRLNKEPLLVRLSEYTRTPGGRYVRQMKGGKHSAEEWRDKHLLPMVKAGVEKGEKVYVDLDGVAGLPASFVEESFGGLVREGKLPASQLFDTLLVHCMSEPDVLEDIETYIQEADEVAAVFDGAIEALTSPKQESSMTDLYLDLAAAAGIQMRKGFPQLAEEHAEFGIKAENLSPAGFVLRRGDPRLEEDANWIFEMFIAVEGGMVNGLNFKLELTFVEETWAEVAAKLIALLNKDEPEAPRK